VTPLYRQNFRWTICVAYGIPQKVQIENEILQSGLKLINGIEGAMVWDTFKIKAYQKVKRNDKSYSILKELS
jgi:hypothetical protein